MSLTDKQRAFIEHYLQLWNGTEAARRAKYQGNDNTLASIASENLRKPKIREEIERRIESEAMSANEVLWRLAEQARASVLDFIDVRPAISTVDDPVEGGEPEEDAASAEEPALEFVINLEKARRAGKLHLIRKLKYDSSNRPTIELHDAQSALELLGKHLGLFRETFDHRVAIFDPEEWQRRRQERLQEVSEMPDLNEVGSGTQDP